ncbi:hypothetical protein BC833DRAFT_342441 [Globomyces pollinis-pini]|nr:hypothetical protein BC833DRAFT_342441 [Globomyces pollinis-pini]
MTMKKPIITYGKNNSTVKRKLEIDDDESRSVLKPRNPFDKNITVSTITNQALKPKKTTIQPTKKKLIQTCLVFGQKSKRIKCPICLMDYQQSSTEDVAIHNQFHLNFIKGLQWNGKTKGIISIKSTAPMSLWKRVNIYY